MDSPGCAREYSDSQLGAGVEGAVALEGPLMPVVSYYCQKEPAGGAVICRFRDLRKFRT
jgi:hypothetical protein